MTVTTATDTSDGDVFDAMRKFEEKLDEIGPIISHLRMSRATFDMMAIYVGYKPMLVSYGSKLIPIRIDESVPYMTTKIEYVKRKRG